jgi:ethanolamine transporter
MLPLLVISVIITLGLIFFQKITLVIFRIFGQFIRIVIVVGLALGLFTFVTGVQIHPILDGYENCAMISVNATAIMAGAFPLLFCLSKALKKALRKMGSKLGINEASAMGFVSTVATSMATFEMMDDMDSRGVMLNSAFAISAGFVLAGHLAFTFALCPDMAGPMMVGKLVSGVAAVVFAMILFKNKK